MVEVLDAEPKQITAGDSISWKVTYSDYRPSQGWSLAYLIVTSLANHAISTTDSSDSYLVALASADTTSYNPETAKLVGYATKGSDRITVYSDDICINRNLVDITPGTDTRSDAKKALDAVESSFLTLGSKAWTQSYTIGDKSVTFRNFDEFMKFYNNLRAIVAKENAAADLKAGRRPKNRILAVY